MSAVIRSLKTVPSPQRERTGIPGPEKATPGTSPMSIAREPFVQFIVLGALIWVGVEYWNVHHDRYRIQVGSAERQRIATTYQQQFGQLPTPIQLRRLIDRYVREEIFLREGLALRLEKDDEIVRRRIVQKYEFLKTDLAVPDSPGPGVLGRWYEQNKFHYLSPQRVAFAHVYFSPDRVGDAAAITRALKVLKKLRLSGVSRAPDFGDAFPGPSDVGALAPEEAVRLFGQSELSNHIFKAPLGQWAGPYRSGYGWHLIYVTGHSPPVLPPLGEIRERVLADYMDEQRRLLNEQAYEELRARYIVRDDGAVP
jgi:peptidyl-prolyl cis-trans isomerase C